MTIRNHSARMRRLYQETALHPDGIVQLIQVPEISVQSCTTDTIYLRGTTAAVLEAIEVARSLGKHIFAEVEAVGILAQVQESALLLADAGANYLVLPTSHYDGLPAIVRDVLNEEGWHDVGVMGLITYQAYTSPGGALPLTNLKQGKHLASQLAMQGTDAIAIEPALLLLDLIADIGVTLPVVGICTTDEQEQPDHLVSVRRSGADFVVVNG